MAEKAQRLSADTQLFRDIFTASPVGIAVENLEGQPLLVNPALCSMLGFSEEEMRTKQCVQCSPPEDAEKDWALFQQLRAGSIDHYQLEKRYFRRDGSLFWGRLSISLLKSRPSPLVVARVEDITDERRADEALRASEERLRLAQQAACIGTFEWNIETGLNTWTPQLEEIYGLPPGGFGGTQTAFENLVHPDDRAGVIELNNRALKTGNPTEGEWRVVWPDGSVHWIAGRWQVFLNESGEPLRMVGVNGDVTQRKRVEEALRESEERFRLAAQAGKVYAYENHLPTETVVRSPEYAKILGLTEPERFTYQQFLDGIHPADRARFLEAVATLTPENPSSEVTYRFLRPIGGVVWLKSSGRGFFDREQELVRVVGMVADVTEHKQAEEAMSTVSSMLIQAQERERKRIGRELHDDINQRLAMLTFELEQLKDRPSEVQSRVEELLKQTRELSNDVQALSHELHSSKLEYLGVASGIGSWCKEFGERQGIEIDVKIDVRGPIPLEIGVTLFRILQESLHNAVKHSGVKHIDVQLSERSNEIQLTIADTGKGFDVEAARQSRGLGLASMEERARLVKGTIAIESRPMSGTAIYVRVPLDLEQALDRKAV
jgi:PAS domain S-box-containing protein